MEPTVEITGAQVSTRFGSQHLNNPLPKSYDTYRTMAKDPTIAMVSELSAAPIVSGEWSIETEDDATDEMKDVIETCVTHLREPFVDTCVKGGGKFGWQGFEKVFELRDGKVIVRKLKPLLHDITSILVDARTGAFAGYQQHDVVLPLEYSLHVGFRVEGTQWHGNSLLENARETFNQWQKANDGAERYDGKVAGSHFVVYFPPGKSKGADGVEAPNYTIAGNILDALESSGSISVPRVVGKWIKDLENVDPDKLGWKIEILEDKGGRQPTFIDRLKYLDTQKARALITPERVAMEGEFGTKAEAGVHQQLWIMYLDLVHRHIVRHINWYLVDQLLVLNWGEKARSLVHVKAAPTTDAQILYLQQLYSEIIKTPAGFGEEWQKIDSGAVRDTLGVPELPEDRQEDLPAEGSSKEEIDDLAATTR